jgi:pimeloyl-ACP methyl ester carboxylesterase
MPIDHERRKIDFLAKTIEIHGRSISLMENTSGDMKPTIVLIHGFGAIKENWIWFARQLPESFHVVAIDLPGHGESFKDFDARYDLDDQVRYLKHILSYLNIQQCHLVGNSMGGAISALYAAAYPEQVQSLLLIDPAGIYDYDCELNRLLKAGKKNPLIVERVEDYYVLMDFVMEKKPFIPWHITNVIAEKAVKNRPINDRIFSDLHGEHQYDFREELKKISAPTLILWGEKDRVIAVENAQIFNRLIPYSKKVILDGIGHMPMIENPKKSAKIYLDFLASIYPASCISYLAPQQPVSIR